jgi:hypothetical protein
MAGGPIRKQNREYPDSNSVVMKSITSRVYTKYLHFGALSVWLSPDRGSRPIWRKNRCRSRIHSRQLYRQIPNAITPRDVILTIWTLGGQKCPFQRRPVLEGGAIQTGTQKAVSFSEMMGINRSHGSITVRSVSVAALITVVTLFR